MARLLRVDFSISTHAQSFKERGARAGGDNGLERSIQNSLYPNRMDEKSLVRANPLEGCLFPQLLVIKIMNIYNMRK